eukprot:363360-Chlamydomonas_euryale.AAC.8
MERTERGGGTCTAVSLAILSEHGMKQVGQVKWGCSCLRLAGYIVGSEPCQGDPKKGEVSGGVGEERWKERREKRVGERKVGLVASSRGTPACVSLHSSSRHAHAVECVEGESWGGNGQPHWKLKPRGRQGGGCLSVGPRTPVMKVKTSALCRWTVRRHVQSSYTSCRWTVRRQVQSSYTLCRWTVRRQVQSSYTSCRWTVRRQVQSSYTLCAQTGVTGMPRGDANAYTQDSPAHRTHLHTGLACTRWVWCTASPWAGGLPPAQAGSGLPPPGRQWPAPHRRAVVAQLGARLDTRFACCAVTVACPATCTLSSQQRRQRWWWQWHCHAHCATSGTAPAAHAVLAVHAMRSATPMPQGAAGLRDACSADARQTAPTHAGPRRRTSSRADASRTAPTHSEAR